MPRLKLTHAAVERIKPPTKGQTEYFDELLPSFALRVSYSGTKAWIVFSRIDGKLVRSTLGRYPAMSLAEARNKAREALEFASRGIDPRRVEEAARLERDEQASNTFERLVEEFLEKHVQRNLRPSTAREYRRILRGPDTQVWRHRPIGTISKREVLGVLDGIETRGAPGAARLALAYLRKFFNWCAERELIDHPPTDRMKLSGVLKSRDRTLSEAEIAVVWKAFDAESGMFGLLFKLLLLTGQRRGEVAGMRWDELRDLDRDNALWEIPGSRTKNHQAQLVPLSPLVRQIIRDVSQTGPLVFSTTGRTPVSGFSRAKLRIDLWIVDHVQAEGLAQMPPWTLHDLRRTMVTMMNERLSIPPHIVEAVVNHISGSARAGVAGVYNRALYIDDRRAALSRWADLLSRLTCASQAESHLDMERLTQENQTTLC